MAGPVDVPGKPDGRTADRGKGTFSKIPSGLHSFDIDAFYSLKDAALFWVDADAYFETNLASM